MSEPVGVLVMSYGTPSSPEGVEAFYTHVRGGREPEPDQLADLRHRYEAIGGSSPLRQRIESQARGLQRALDAIRPGGFKVYLGARHAPPFIEDGVAAMSTDGIQRAVALVMAPHYSSLSVGKYLDRAGTAAAEAGIALGEVRSWHMEPGFIHLLASRVRGAVAELSPTERDDAELIVTAHSLPERIVASGDPYPDQMRETGEAVARAAGCARWRTAWQSAGRTTESWLGPDVGEVIRLLGDEGVRAVVICPGGFTSDHLEVLYDIDIEAKRTARDAGVELVRTASLNDDPALMDVLAAVVLGEATHGSA